MTMPARDPNTEVARLPSAIKSKVTAAMNEAMEYNRRHFQGPVTWTAERDVQWARRNLEQTILTHLDRAKVPESAERFAKAVCGLFEDKYMPGSVVALDGAEEFFAEIGFEPCR